MKYVFQAMKQTMPMMAMVMFATAMFVFPSLAMADIGGLTTQLFLSDNVVGGIRLAMIVGALLALWALIQAFRSGDGLFAPGLFFGVMLYMAAETASLIRLVTDSAAQ